MRERGRVEARQKKKVFIPLSILKKNEKEKLFFCEPKFLQPYYLVV